MKEKTKIKKGEKIKLKKEKEVIIVEGEENVFYIGVHEIKNIYQGSREITSIKLKRTKENFKKTGKLVIRPFERILFKTGITINEELPKNIKIVITDFEGLFLDKGLKIFPMSFYYKEEINIAVYNSTPYYSELTTEDIVAKLSLTFIVSKKLAEITF